MTKGHDWEALVNDGIEARKLGDQSNWLLGDLAAEVETDYGHGDLEKYAMRIGVAFKSLQSYRTVAASFGEKSRRLDNLTWSHHQVVAGRDDADKLLATAKRKKLTVDQLRELAGVTGGRRSSRDPAPLEDIGVFNLILADPPWFYEDATPSRAIENQYPTMSVDAIAAMKIPAAKDAVLFLWATSPKLSEAMFVMEQWGFEYRTNMAWVKPQLGMGYYWRSKHELLLLGKRGSFPAPGEKNRPDSVLVSSRRKHSQKPDEAYTMIERMYPRGVDRLEMFARQERKGWTSWGNEI